MTRRQRSHDGQRRNLLIATNIPSPYQVDFFNAVAEHPELHLLVMYSYPRAPALLWEDQLPRIRHRHVILGERPRLVPRPRAFTVVNRFRPDFVIVGGYYDPNFFAAALASARSQTPWAMWAEEPSLYSGLARKVARPLFLFPMLRLSHAILGMGRRACETYRRLSGGELPVYNLHYYRDLTGLTAIGREGSHDPPVFLQVGSFIRRKACGVAVRAFNRLVASGCEARLRFVGTGPLLEETRSLLSPEAKRLAEFTGFVPWRDLPDAFAGGDVLVFPTRWDGWGMVTGEAMAAGMPVIGSTAAGSVVDLVEDGVNGFAIRPDDADALYEKMRFFCAKPEKVLEFGARGRERMRTETPEAGAEKLARIVSELLAGKG